VCRRALGRARRARGGRAQAVEAKEGLPIRASTDLQGSITFQTLFQFYPKLAGMTARARAPPPPGPPAAPCRRPPRLRAARRAARPAHALPRRPAVPGGVQEVRRG